MSSNERVMRQVPPTTVILSLESKALGRTTVVRLGMSIRHWNQKPSLSRMTC